MANQELRKCEMCGQYREIKDFVPSYSPFWNNYITCFCFECVVDKFNLQEIDLNVANRICQQFNVAFFPDEWIKLFSHEKAETALRKYIAKFFDINYRTYDWSEQNKLLMQKAKEGTINAEIEELNPMLFKELRERWGDDYSEEKLLKLEKEYNLAVADFNVEADLQKSQLRKIVKLSIIVDENLDKGVIDKDLIAQYKGLLKDFLASVERMPHSNLSTLSQVFAKIEALGFRPNFDFSEPKDQVDFFLQNIQEYNRDLFKGETLIQEQYEQMKLLAENTNEELDDLEDEEDEVNPDEVIPW